MFINRNKFNNMKETSTAPSTAAPATGFTPTLIQPKSVEINGYKFVISKMPCTVAQEVIIKLPTGLVPLLSDFSQAEDMAFKMLSYCERVYSDGRPNVGLISKEIIDNHVPDFDTLVKLETECINYNYDFFSDGKLLAFLNKGVCLVESKASGILTDLLDKLLQAGAPRSGN